MLRLLLAAGGRSGGGGGGGAKRRFMDVVGKDMKLVTVRGKKKRRKGAEIDEGGPLAVAAPQGNSHGEKERDSQFCSHVRHRLAHLLTELHESRRRRDDYFCFMSLISTVSQLVFLFTTFCTAEIN